MDPNASANPDRYWDESVQMWLTHSGRARWRRILAERNATRDVDGLRAFREQLRPGPSRRREERAMRRPEVELSDAAARYVEDHPGVIEKLAKGIPDAEQELRQRVRDRVRARLGECRAYAESPQGEAAGAAWLAQYGVSAEALQ